MDDQRSCFSFVMMLSVVPREFFSLDCLQSISSLPQEKQSTCYKRIMGLVCHGFTHFHKHFNLEMLKKISESEIKKFRDAQGAAVGGLLELMV